MIHSLIVCSAIALQGAGAARPASPSGGQAAPIAVAPSGVSGPTVDVPPELARLTGPETIAVLYVPSVAQLQQAVERCSGLGEGPAGALPSAATMRQLLKQAVRTELEIPLDQPALWWVDMRLGEGDEPEMGVGNLVMHQAFRVPGAMAATEKARADAAKADPKTRVAMPVRARDRRGAVSVLAGDLVVTSSDGEPFAQAADGSAPSRLLDRMPRGQASGRVDLERAMAENADQLRMMGGFVPMMLGGAPRPGEQASAEERNAFEMRQALVSGVGRQVTALVDALMQLKRASFAIDLQGDELHVWADWSRELAFPAGLDEATVNALAARLPAGMVTYFGASSSALDAMYGERFLIDDVLGTLGDTPEQKQAWEQAMKSLRAAVGRVERGMVGGLAIERGQPMMLAAMRLSDAAAFRADLTEAAAAMSRSGLAEVQAKTDVDRLDWVAIPNGERLRQITAIGGLTDERADEMLEAASAPVRLTMRFSGNEVMLSYTRGEGAPLEPTAGGADIRAQLTRGGWGTADWFASADLRHLIVRMFAEVTVQLSEMKDGGLKAELQQALDRLGKGAPAIVRLRQGVQQGTARLSIDMNIAELKAIAADVDAIMKQSARNSGKAGDADEDDDDDDEEEKGKGAAGADEHGT